MQNIDPNLNNSSEQPTLIRANALNQSSWQQKASTCLGLFSLVVVGAGATFSASYLAAQNQTDAKAVASQASPLPTRSTVQSRLPIATDANFIAAVVERVGPAVVRIDASRTVQNRIPAAFNDPFFRRFFGSEVPRIPSERVERGTGSGFIINANGHILTNAHVIDGANTVTVTLKDGREFQGRVLGVDPVTDVAVIKIEANNLPSVNMGNSEQLKPGEWAIAIGNPLGLDNSVTVGIISATGRSSNQAGAPDKRVSFIQTDAAINPGNSGGPLINARGEAIGMNTAIIRGAQGLGFAIPINTAQRIAEQLIAKGKVDHPFLGIQMVTLTPELRKNINSDPNSGLMVEEDRGVLIVKVLSDSPAAKAGLRMGDVITKVNAQSVAQSNQVQQAVENSQVGGTLPMEVRRNGQTINIVVRPGVFPAQVR